MSSEISTGGRLPAVAGLASALVAASCCLLPIALISVGLAGGGLMITAMRFQFVSLPLGILGLAAAYWMYWRHRRRCRTTGCRVAGQGTTLVVLGMATVIIVVALILMLFPSWTASLLGAGPLSHAH